MLARALVLVGPPGSGKGTQGPVLAAHLGVPHLSTGDLLRREVDAGTDLGRRVAELIDRGELVPDDLMMRRSVARGARRTDGPGYVLDGFPRTVAQAEALEAGGAPLPPPDLAVHLDVPDDVRSSGSPAAPRRRAGPTTPIHEVIERRLRVYHDDTEPLVQHYRQLDALVTVDGDGSLDEVTRRLLAAVRDRQGDAGASPGLGERRRRRQRHPAGPALRLGLAHGQVGTGRGSPRAPRRGPAR